MNISLQVNREKTGLVNKITAAAFGYEFVRNFVFNKAKEQVLKLTGGLYPAPLRVSISFAVILKEQSIELCIDSNRSLKWFALASRREEMPATKPNALVSANCRQRHNRKDWSGCSAAKLNARKIASAIPRKRQKQLVSWVQVWWELALCKWAWTRATK